MISNEIGLRYHLPKTYINSKGDIVILFYKVVDYISMNNFSGYRYDYVSIIISISPIDKSDDIIYEYEFIIYSGLKLSI